MPFRAAARNSSTAWSGGADHSFASAIGRMLRRSTIGACRRKSMRFGAKSMRGRIAREFRAKRIESLAGGGLHQVLSAPARDKRGTVALANDPLDPRRSLAELSVKDARMLPHESQEAGGLGHAGEDQPTALAFGNELASPLPPPHRAVLVLSDLEKAAILLPFAKILLPSRRERPDLAMDEAADTALTVDPFLKLNGGDSRSTPKGGRCRRQTAISPPAAWRNVVPGDSGRWPLLFPFTPPSHRAAWRRQPLGHRSSRKAAMSRRDLR